MWQDIEQAIGDASGRPFAIETTQAVPGGCINEALCLRGGGRAFFLKLNRAGRLGMFEAEADGLRALAAAQCLRVPQVVALGESGERSWLALEYVAMGGSADGAGPRLGEQLAALHRCPRAQFGWHRDNTIGETPQPNSPSGDWPGFWREHRLGYQLHLARERGAGQLAAPGERLMEGLCGFFDNYSPQPSLLHGDLWGGNWSVDNSGQPVLFDPAVYCGDREADIAMTELFGGFDGGFYDAYNAAWPLDPGYPVRRELYNLYHLLNHFNLFGGGYALQSRQAIERLLAELG